FEAISSLRAGDSVRYTRSQKRNAQAHSSDSGRGHAPDILARPSDHSAFRRCAPVPSVGLGSRDPPKPSFRAWNAPQIVHHGVHMRPLAAADYDTKVARVDQKVARVDQ